MSMFTPGGDPRFDASEPAPAPTTSSAATPAAGVVGGGPRPPVNAVETAGGFLAAPAPSAAVNRPELGAPRWLFPSVIGVLAALALLGGLIFYVQGQKDKADTSVYRHTTVSTPAAVAGLTLGIGPGVENVSSRVQLALAADGVLQPAAAGYIDSDGNSDVYVAGGKKVTAPGALLSTARSAATNFTSGIANEGGSTTPIALSSYPAGVLGGVMQCGPTQVEGIDATFCVSVDQGAIIQTLVATGDVKSGAATALSVRTAVEQRTS